MIDLIEKLRDGCMLHPERWIIDEAATDALMAEAAAEIEALRAEVERLTGCLATANANHETFERRWYLAHDRAEQLAEALRSKVAGWKKDVATKYGYGPTGVAVLSLANQVDALLRRALTEAAAALEAAREDAEDAARYRWLRENHSRGITVTSAFNREHGCGKFTTAAGTFDTLDAAIDQARGKEEK